MPGLLGFPARLLPLASLSVATMLGSLWSGEARACDWESGIVAVHPPVESTLAVNAGIVLSLVDASIDDYAIEVTVNGNPATVEVVPLVEETTVFVDQDLVALRFAQGALTFGDAVSVGAVTDGSEVEKLATYTVGGPDKTGLVPDDATASVALQFVASDEADSCGLPDRYEAVATLEPALGVEDGRRSRFVQLVFYPQGGTVDEAVGRSVVAVGESIEEAYGGFSADQDPAALCAQVSVIEASGNEEILFEDCALCESSPDACEPIPGGTDTDGAETGGSGTDGGQTGGETSGGSSGGGGGQTDTDSAGGANDGGGGCTVAGSPPVSWALVVLGMLGVTRRRRRR